MWTKRIDSRTKPYKRKQSAPITFTKDLPVVS